MFKITYQARDFTGYWVEKTVFPATEADAKKQAAELRACGCRVTIERA